MTCDEAFDLLTDAAHPHERRLRAHLDQCPRCRAMHDTLSPAIGLFASVAERNVTVAPSQGIAQSSARRLLWRSKTGSRQSRVRRRAGLCLAFAAALSCVAFAAVGLRHEVQGMPDSSADSQCLWVTRADAPARGSRETAAFLLTAQCAACHGSLAPRN